MGQTETDTLREKIAAKIRTTDNIDLLRELIKLLEELNGKEDNPQKAA